jgi:hypothetical protein
MQATCLHLAEMRNELGFQNSIALDQLFQIDQQLVVTKLFHAATARHSTRAAHREPMSSAPSFTSMTCPIFAHGPTPNIRRKTDSKSKCVTMPNANQGVFDAWVNVAAINLVSSCAWSCVDTARCTAASARQTAKVSDQRVALS